MSFCLYWTHSFSILIADEVDQIPKAILAQLFTWPTDPQSKLILIGLSNTLDMASRVLPHLTGAPPRVSVTFFSFGS